MMTWLRASLHRQSYYPCDFFSRDPVVENKDKDKDEDDDDEEDDGDNELLSLRLLLSGPC